MNFKCCNCDSIFDYEDADRVPEADSSEFWGSVAWGIRYYLACPSCGSDEICEHIEDGDCDDDC